jgi:hypothetical protein
MEAIGSSETSVDLYRTAQRSNPEDRTMNSDHCEHISENRESQLRLGFKVKAI